MSSYGADYVPVPNCWADVAVSARPLITESVPNDRRFKKGGAKYKSRDVCCITRPGSYRLGNGKILRVG